MVILIFNKREKNIQWGKITFSTGDIGPLRGPYAIIIIIFDPHITQDTKINSTWVIDLNVKSKTIKP